MGQLLIAGSWLSVVLQRMTGARLGETFFGKDVKPAIGSRK